MGNKPLWKNVSGTFVFVLDGGLVTIQAGETFRANDNEISSAFKDSVIKVEEATEQKPIEPAEVEVTDTQYSPARDRPMQKKIRK